MLINQEALAKQLKIDNASKTELTSEQYSQYLEQNVIPVFEAAVNAPMYLSVFNSDYELVFCSNQSANSIGFESWHKALGASYKDYTNAELGKQYFKNLYNNDTRAAIHQYVKNIFKIQQFVFKYGKMASFIDLLPYNNVFNAYLISYTPIFHPNGKVIAILSTALEYDFFNLAKHFTSTNKQPDLKHLPIKNLTVRQEEILFLLASGATQEQIAQILNIKRSTVAGIIRNQLCLRLNIAGSNTKLLAQLAIEHGCLKRIPQSLWRYALDYMA